MNISIPLCRSTPLVAIALSTITSLASAGLVRNFDSVPAGDTISGGAVLSPSGAPGNPSSQMNNTAAPAWGNQAANYTGQYVVGDANLAAALGTTSLSAFTLSYAYKPDIPNDPDTSARQLAIRVDGAGSETLGIGLSSYRQDVAINGISVGSPPFAPAYRLMDGDPNTVNFDSGGSGGSCCSSSSEWVFFALTYQVLIPGVSARVQMFGESQSEANMGLQQIFDGTGYFNDTVDISGRALILGNTGFGNGTVWRPSDESFDALQMDARVLSLSELSARASGVINPVPEPASIVILVSSGLGLLVVARGGRRAASC